MLRYIIFHASKNSLFFLFAHFRYILDILFWHLNKIKFKLFQLSLSHLRYLIIITSQLCFHLDWSSTSPINLLSKINNDCYHILILMQIRIPFWFFRARFYNNFPLYILVILLWHFKENEIQTVPTFIKPSSILNYYGIPNLPPSWLGLRFLPRIYLLKPIIWT